mmetsp:Transcript_80025/g.248333  ORF Transcript_80025/g.248333 Transcript_80025/m.248333 type:complete len:102 (-) Transcript_80025:113-418(-)
MRGATKPCVFALILGIAASLQGCGCDKDKGKKCVTDFSATLAATPCASYNTMSTCIKDTGCCDLEENGQTMKDVLTRYTITMNVAGCGVLAGRPAAVNNCL